MEVADHQEKVDELVSKTTEAHKKIAEHNKDIKKLGDDLAKGLTRIDKLEKETTTLRISVTMIQQGATPVVNTNVNGANAGDNNSNSANKNRTPKPPKAAKYAKQELSP